MTLAPGTQLERYTLQESLGAGGFGITYRAWDNREEKAVAIKENFPAWLVQRESGGGVRLIGSPEDFEWTQRHFIEEARILAKLSHPNIVRIYRAFACNGTAYFVMEYLNATGLDKRVGATFWTESTLLALSKRLLDALGCVHKLGICHRDIKPANIMLRNADNSPVLIDFGAAKSGPSYSEYTRGFVSMGYTAPEQMADPGNTSPSIDIYALGATLYHLLTGAPPINASARLIKDDLEPLQRRQDLLARFSQPLLASIDKALALDSARRYSSAGQWLHALQVCSSSLSFDPTPTPAPKPTPAPLPAVEFSWQKLFLYCFRVGFVFSTIIALSLLSPSTEIHTLDGYACPVFMLTGIGFVGVLYYRMRSGG